MRNIISRMVLAGNKAFLGKTRTVLNTTMNEGTFTTQQDQDKQKGHSGQDRRILHHLLSSVMISRASMMCRCEGSMNAIEENVTFGFDY
jgi:hypothetical protein